MLDAKETKRFTSASVSCPFLKAAPIIPYANKFYLYCDIKHGASRKYPLKMSHVRQFCCNPNIELAFTRCPIWLENPEDVEEQDEL